MAVLGESRLRTGAVAGAAFAGVLALVGSLVPLLTANLTVMALGGYDRRFTVSLSTWHVATTWLGDDAELWPGFAEAVNGYPLVLAAVLLLAASAVSARATRAGSAAVATVAGAAFLAGVVWPVGMDMMRFVRMFQYYRGGDSGTVAMTIGPGVWLLGTAVVLGVAAAAAALLRARGRVAAPPSDTEDTDAVATPPMGFRVLGPEQEPGRP